MTKSDLDRADADAFRVAVIGSGPSGFYATEALLRSGTPLAVDMFEQLPVPYGLVRFGVAPDHPKLKLVTTAFDRIAKAPGFRFIGGVAVGRDVSIDELRDSYDAVVLATGADVSRSLGIPGEDLPGTHHAGDFVAWYNGHPDYRDRHFDFGCEAATVIGHGNVALDVARILAKTADELRRTDIAAHALEALAESRIREIRVVGRGRPPQAKFSAKELRDFLELETCDTTIDSRDVVQDDFTPDNQQEPGTDRKAGAAPHIFAAGFDQARGGAHSGSACRPLLSGDRAGWRRSTSPNHQVRSRDIDCGLVFRSVGRRTAPLDGIPYDDVRGVHANIDGRVADWLLYRRRSLCLRMEQAWSQRHHRHQPRLRHGHRRGHSCRSAGAGGAADRGSRHAAGAAQHAGCARPEFCRLGGHRRG